MLLALFQFKDASLTVYVTKRRNTRLLCMMSWDEQGMERLWLLLLLLLLLLCCMYMFWNLREMSKLA